VDEGTAMKIRPLRRVLTGARRLHEDEGGAALVFAVITLFSLALAMFMVFQIGLVTTDRLQIQTAADAAAYSGAQVEANAINSIGQINDGMAYVHYASLRYVLDQIVYGTLHMFETHGQYVGQNQPELGVSQYPPGAIPGGLASEFGPMIEGGPNGRATPAWVMLGDENEWSGNNGRWTRTRDRGKKAIEEGKKWLSELNAASHLILRATPRLVREKAAEVAFLNGASHVAVSSDLEHAIWKQEEGQTGTQGTLGDGFIDAVGLNDNSEVASSLPLRYMDRKLKVDEEHPVSKYPSWFVPEKGTYRNTGYTSIRICWNPNDWAHRTPATQHDGFEWSEVPNGHWHAHHLHWYLENGEIPMSRPHGGLTGNVQEAPCAGGVGGGHEADDFELHLLVEESKSLGFMMDQTGEIAHHAVVRCPTCQSNDGAGSGQQWTQLKKATDPHLTEDGSLTLALTFETDDFPKPLLIAAPLLRSGVTVATWRESHGVGEILPKSDWGMIAVASAQIGLLDQQGRVRALQKLEGTQATYGSGEEFVLELDRSKDTKYRNLHYSDDNSKLPGMRFGARLVPIRGQLTHHPKLQGGGDASAVEELLKDGARWYTTSDPSNPAPSNITKGEPPGLPALRGWFAVNSFEELREVFWH
jgi:hypothetical protein